jgi:ribosomal protein S18 acetylase RimI-like enzyme
MARCRGARWPSAGGQTVITLNVNVDNPHAAALYRRLGFAQAGRRARYAVVA